MVSPVRPDIALSDEARNAAQPRRVSREFTELMSARVREASGAKAHAERGIAVEPQRTALSGEQAASALGQAWTQITGERPSAATTAVLTAQWAHETGHGASMFNYNFGGIKGVGPSGLTVAQRTREGFGTNERQIVDRFRAYSTASEGAADYVRLLKNQFPKALEAAGRGDAEGFVHALKARGYFTGEETAYVNSVSSLARQALGSGFDAIGGARGPTEGRGTNPLDGFDPAAARELDGIVAFGSPTDAAGPTPFVDALRIADEISRAALRIAASDPSKRDT